MAAPAPRTLAILTTVSVVLLIPLFVSWSTPPPAEALQSVRATLAQADAEGARQLLPEPRETARQDHAALRREMARQQRWLPGLRHYGDSRERLAQASVSATALLTETRHTIESQRDASVALQNQARAALLAARAAAAQAHVQAAGRRALMQAQLALDEAGRYHQRRQFDQAADKAHWVIERCAEWESHSNVRLSRITSDESTQLWDGWIRETVTWSAKNNEFALVVDKSARQVFIYYAGDLLRSFPADLGLNPISDKLAEGDNATPEGRYFISQVKEGDQTRYHRAFLLDYPNAEDRKRFKAAIDRGDLQGGVGIGGLIEIHGYGGRGEDWTEGCVAIGNAEMDHLARMVQVGTPVTIVGRSNIAPPPAARLAPVAAGSRSGGGKPL